MTFIIANGDVPALKNAITTSNGNAQDDTIELFSGGAYTLTVADNGLNGLPRIAADSSHKLTINGNGATLQRSAVGGTPAFRIFYINSGGNLTLSRLILSNGNPGAFHGGAIYNDGETANVSLTISGCTISGCSGDYGGAIFNDGYQDPSFPAHTATLTVTNSTFSNNTGSQHGGAIWNESGSIVMNVSNSTFSSNSANGSAGAIQFDGSGGTATGSITNCTFSQNSARSFGGAVNVDGAGGSDGLGNPANGSAILNITNCTFDQNVASHPTLAKGWGGGVALDGSNGTNGSTGNATVNVDSCTFSGNLSKLLGDAIYLSETTSGTTVLQIGNSILASSDADYNISTDNISGGTVTVISQGYNVSDDASCGVDPCNDPGTGPGGLLNHVGDLRNTNPLLGTLANNGGPTNTIALQAASPAINHGINATAPARDQRYYLRNGAPDTGAFEFSGTLAPVTAASVMTHGATSFSVDLPLAGTVGIEPRNGGASGNFQVVANFATPVTATSASVTSGVGNATLGGVNGSQVTINLTNIANAQQIAVTINNASDGFHTNNVNIPARFLIGDTNGDASVNSGDIGQTKSKSGQAVDTTNFRSDVTADGSINSADIGLVKSKSGTAIP